MQNLHKTLFCQQFSLQPIIVQFLHINTWTISFTTSRVVCAVLAHTTLFDTTVETLIRKFLPLREHFEIMLLDKVLDYRYFVIPERTLQHHPGRAIGINEELGSALLPQFAIPAGMNVHCLQDTMRRKVKPMPQNLFCKILWHGQAAVMYLRFSDTMRMAISDSTSSMLVSLSAPDAMM